MAEPFGILFKRSWTHLTEVAGTLAIGMLLLAAVAAAPFSLLFGADQGWLNVPAAVFGIMPVLVIVAVCFSVLAFTAFFAVIVRRERNFATALRIAGSKFFPLIGVKFVMAWRGGAWLMLAGFAVMIVADVSRRYGTGSLYGALMTIGGFTVVAGVIYMCVRMPRFLLAPIIMMKEDRGIAASAQASYARTAGYWTKIVGNLALFGISTWALGLILIFGIGIVMGLIGGDLMALAAVVAGTAQVLWSLLLYFWQMTFTYQLAATIFANPIDTPKT